ncbi:MAG TPA: hypothetical protein VNN81_07950 [Bradyrhizobium sp.]|nr:hypothetical protein [Bradyrhizobium sp.]
MISITVSYRMAKCSAQGFESGRRRKRCGALPPAWKIIPGSNLMLLLSSQFAAFSEKLDQIAALPKYDRLSTNNYNVDSRAIVMQPTSFEENVRAA